MSTQAAFVKPFILPLFVRSLHSNPGGTDNNFATGEVLKLILFNRVCSNPGKLIPELGMGSNPGGGTHT